MKRNVLMDGNGSDTVMIEGLGPYVPVSQVRPMQAEMERLREALTDEAMSRTMLKGMAVENGGLNVELEGGMCALMVEAFADQFKRSGGTNFVELSFAHEEIGQLTVTLQRAEGKTPGALKAEAEQECDQLKAYQAELVRELTSCQSVLFMLARAGEVTPAYADDAMAVLKREPKRSLAVHDAEAIGRARAYVTSEVNSDSLAEDYDSALEDYANQLRQQAQS